MTPLESELQELLALYKRSPVAMVEQEFGVQPDPWQRDALEAFPHCQRLALKACTGPGKTAVEAWIGWNFALTREHAMIGCASITRGNLESNLWPEFSRWQAKSPLLQQLFEKTGKNIYAKAYPDTWRIEARSFAQKADETAIANSFAGLHAEHVMWLLDETGDMPIAVLPACEAIFSGSPAEAHIVQAGNPSSRSGALYRAWRNSQGANPDWRVVTITADPDDPKRTPRVSIEHARQQIAEYGRENPWIRFKIFGEFPEADFNALIGEEEVRAAFNRYYRAPTGAKIIGVDVADMGDDQTVLFFRCGLQGFAPKKLRKVNSVDGAAIAARHWREFPHMGGEADALFLDATGGWGAGWRDQLIALGRAPQPVNFSGESRDSAHFNRRAEMYWNACEWIKRGGALVESAELLSALTMTNYTTRNGKTLLEPKIDVKKKIGFSPDECDAFVLTFADPVTPKSINAYGQPRNILNDDFQPFSERDMGRVGQGGRVLSDFDPFRER